MALTDDPDPGRTCSAIHCEGFEVSREWLGRTFQSYGSPVFDRNPDGSIRVHAPQSRYEKAKRYALNRYGAGSFCKCKIAGLPTTSGVYVLCINGDPRYVGKAVHLQKRYGTGYGNTSQKNCFVGGQQTNCRINQLILKAALAGEQIELFALACEDHDLLEQELIQHRKPEWNRQGLL